MNQSYYKKWISQALIVILLLSFLPAVEQGRAQTLNLVDNSGFEQMGGGTGNWDDLATSPMNWKAWFNGANSLGTASTTVVQDVYHSGSSALKISSVGHDISSDYIRVAVTQHAVGVDDQKQYNLSAWMKTDQVMGIDASKGAMFRAQFKDGAGTKIANSTIPATQAISGTTDWKNYSLQLDPPVGTEQILVEFYLDRGVGTVWFDDIELTEIVRIPIQSIDIELTDLEIVEGDTNSLKWHVQPLDTTETMVWSSSDDSIVTVDDTGTVTAMNAGTALITASNEKGDIQDTIQISVLQNLNDVLNAGFEQMGGGIGNWDADSTSATNWKAWFNGANSLGTASTTVVQDVYHSGNSSVKISSVGNDINNDYVRVAVTQHVSGIDDNEAYQLSAWIKTENVVGKGAMFRAQFKDANGDKVADSGIPSILSVTGTNDWQKHNLILDPPPGTAQILVELYLDKGTGTVWFDDVSLISGWISITSLDIVEDELTIQQLETESLQLNVQPVDAKENTIWISSDESVATVDPNGVVTGVREGKAIITAYGEESRIYDTVIVHVTDNPNADPVQIDTLQLDSQMNMFEGRYRLLNPVVQPLGADVSSLIWTSSDPSIATVENDLVHAIQPGTVEITVQTEDGVRSAVSTVTIEPYIWDEFDDLRMKLKEQVLQTSALDPNDPRMKDLFNEKISSGITNWESMNKNENTSFLWLYDPHTLSLSEDITTNYSKLYSMAEAFSYEDSEVYQNKQLLSDIMSGLEWMYDNKYNENTIVTGNWWHYERGAAKHLVRTVILLHDYLKQDQIDKYMATVDKFAPNTHEFFRSHSSGAPLDASLANVLTNSVTVAGAGSIEKSVSKIEGVRDAIIDHLEYVDHIPEVNGFYEDGSFIQHDDIPYTGTYGMEIIRFTPEILSLLNNTSWEVTGPEIQIIYEAISNAYEPLMYKGAMMDMVRGRSIAKSGLQDHDSGYYLTNSLLRYAEFVDEPYATQFKSLAKYWIEQDTYLNYEQYISDFSDFKLYDDLIADNSIQPRGELDLHKTFSAMNRVVNHKEGYAFGISMYSDRIQNFESILDENVKGWHTGSGMTYLYNNDLGHYSDGFWPTVDPYRIPGTTINTVNMQDGLGEERSPEPWVGGVTFQDEYGATGMSYHALDVKAKKSWFMFDDEIVAVGAGITSGGSTSVETIVENRKIRDDGTNEIVINGQIQPEQLGWEQTLDHVEWVHLEGNVEGSAIGYYFPELPSVQVKKESRTGSWQDINAGETDDPVTRSYMTMWFDHGIQPQDDTYAYVLLPNYSTQEVASYATNPDIEVLRNDAEVQAVQNHSLGLLGANFWNNGGETVGDLTVYQQASVMMQELNGELEISVSDPTQVGSVIEIEIQQKGLQLLEADNNITVEHLEPFIRLTVDVTGAAGESFTAKVKLDMSDLSGLSEAIDNAGQLLINHNVGSGVGDVSAPDHELLQVELDHAQVILNDGVNQSQEVINETEANLLSAIESFKENIIQAANDVSELIAIIDEAQQFHDQAEEGNAVGQYPEGSKEILQNVISEVQMLLNDAANQTQAVVDQSVETLHEALQAFKASVKTPNNVQFNPKAKKGELEGTTRVEAEIDESLYRLVIFIFNEEDETSFEVDRTVLPVGEGVIDPYTIGEEILIPNYVKNKTYLGVYLVDSNDQVIDYKQLKLTNGKIKR
ncbi:polysaccharide lyase family 8 super-sandwich domain-containing protein [Chengkuizengella axinellae]|uniref:Polysaccharide lyase family 8 super-sandwich domain-containing protein n=1 Tax=Chengkuizengella axinellae TaxID=3064388 RepID=A0ABT9J066_9BACL|nr:polysaccharide lyase family 8 super-sandwich domain-containing protein [Chengkuizengella sp. 2205SS18-9]MDP5274787.1 polysaccharide lyase family 8 super-sandwich domain-containing protein [Chengkuizengella sp. 2205SS18-9]